MTEENVPEVQSGSMSKRMLMIAVAIGVFVLVVELGIEGLPWGAIGLGAGVLVIPLGMAVWGGRQRRESFWAPVVFGLIGGVTQLLSIAVPLAISSVLHPDPRFPIRMILTFGTLATALSGVVGAIVGWVVAMLLSLGRSRDGDEWPSGQPESMD